MEGLLPVIIALVISAVFGMRKKKNPSEQAPGPGPVAESPWDDLLRELQDRSEQPPRPVYTPEPDEEDEPEEQPYFTYEEIPRAQPLSYETPEPVVLAEPLREEAPLAPRLVDEGLDLTAPLQGELRVFTPHAVSVSPDEEEDNAGAVFESGFDPRMAVLYSEVFRPKYQD